MAKKDDILRSFKRQRSPQSNYSVLKSSRYMIIKSVTIVNYLCYYDIKEFLLTPGLNIILGENGEGKTKLFEAIEWLFNGENSNLDLLVSAKALHEAEIDQQFPVRVSIKFEQELFTYFVTKSFLVRKVGEGIC